MSDQGPNEPAAQVDLVEQYVRLIAKLDSIDGRPIPSESPDETWAPQRSDARNACLHELEMVWWAMSEEQQEEGHERSWKLDPVGRQSCRIVAMPSSARRPKSTRTIPLVDADEMTRGYAEHLDAIAAILVRAKIITKRAIQRDGITFAIRNRFEPPSPLLLHHAKRSRRAKAATR